MKINSSDYYLELLNVIDPDYNLNNARIPECINLK